MVLDFPSMRDMAEIDPDEAELREERLRRNWEKQHENFEFLKRLLDEKSET